ncbi:MAG: sulfatase [Verrucomicrobia bacterium]|nr:sulfatase [Verrucomicrobiota bacterium]
MITLSESGALWALLNRFKASLSILILCVGFLEVGAGERKNVLFIAVDDLTDTLGCYGDLLAKTPHIDALAASGVMFSRAYNQLPLCNPTRASVMTGRRPDEIKVYDLDRHFRETLPDVETLSQAFMRHGWNAARVGKIYHYNVPAGIGTNGHDDPPSWQEVFNPKGRDKTEEYLIFNAEPHRKISAALSWLAAEGEDEEQTDGMIAREAIRYMERHQDESFFLGVGFFRPHTPYVAPKKYFDMYPLKDIRLPFAPNDDRKDIPVAAFAHNCPVPNYGLDELTLRKAIQAYYACTSFIDAQVGRMMESLRQLELLENTIVVLWSDHGYHLGEHGGAWQKRTLFEKSAKAPLIIRAPGLSGNGTPSHRIVEFVDIYPTLAELAQLEGSQKLSGRSLVPLLKNPLQSWNGNAVTQILRPADDRLSEPVMGISIRTHQWRYTEWGEQGKHGVELYNYHSDPGEFENLAIQPTAELNTLMQKLRIELQKKASATTPVTPFNPQRL